PEVERTFTLVPLERLARIALFVEAFCRSRRWEPGSTLTYLVTVLTAEELLVEPDVDTFEEER
ncbi:hypothetical protein, partial [Weizmannia acidilactici]|uniref:hypothetical protein n=1 Tax=Weizmannia acidilactici TaxID=2607726 RepID=UPI0015629A12